MARGPDGMDVVHQGQPVPGPMCYVASRPSCGARKPARLRAACGLSSLSPAIGPWVRLLARGDGRKGGTRVAPAWRVARGCSCFWLGGRCWWRSRWAARLDHCCVRSRSDRRRRVSIVCRHRRRPRRSSGGSVDQSRVDAADRSNFSDPDNGSVGRLRGSCCSRAGHLRRAGAVVGLVRRWLRSWSSAHRLPCRSSSGIPTDCPRCWSDVVVVRRQFRRRPTYG